MSLILVYRNWIWRPLEITGFLLRFISSSLYVCLIDKCLRDEELLEAAIFPPLMVFQPKCWHTSFMTADTLRPEHNGYILQAVFLTAFSWQLILYMIQIPLRFFLGNCCKKRSALFFNTLFLLASHYMTKLWPCQMTVIFCTRPPRVNEDLSSRWCNICWQFYCGIHNVHTQCCDIVDDSLLFTGFILSVISGFLLE